MKSKRRSFPAAQLNPAWLTPDAYIEFLNQSFPSQWNRTLFDWYLARPFDGQTPDLLIMAHEGCILSGLGIAYRQIQIGDDSPIDVAVLVAGATLPSARGAGLYRAMLQQALEHVRSLGCAAMLGFVTRDNASGRGLRRMGALAIPSFYLSAAAPARRYASPCLPATATIRAFEQQLLEFAPQGLLDESSPPRCARFVYRRPEDWNAQFLNRPHETQLLQPEDQTLALVESVGDVRRLQWLGGRRVHLENDIRALIEHSRRSLQGFFMYSTSTIQAQVARRAGCTVRDGYLLAQPSGHARAAWARLARAGSWSVQSGDRL